MARSLSEATSSTLLISIRARKDPLRNQVVDPAFAEFNLHSLACPRIQHTSGWDFPDLWTQCPQSGFYQAGLPRRCPTKPHDFSGNTWRPNREKAVAAGQRTADPFRFNS